MVITVAIGNQVSQANTYIAGMAVKLFVPISYGMFQANGLIGTINSISGNNFTLNIDSSQFDAFTIPSNAMAETPASLSPAGSRNQQFNNSNVNSLPFMSYNNIGN